MGPGSSRRHNRCVNHANIDGATALRASVLIDIRAQAKVSMAHRTDTPLLLAQGDVTSSAEIPT